MKYFKNTELAKLYNISEKSVRNWIEATRQGKLDLQLHQEGDRYYIANTSKNTITLESLAEKGKKYRNTRGYKTVKPTSEFYGLYSNKQILDIIRNLDIHREIPYQYNYFDGGASHWDSYTQRIIEEKIPSTQNATIAQLKLNTPYLDMLMDSYSAINVIDIGAGNCLPVLDFLEYLVSKEKLKRYIAVDISPDMLKIAERNIKNRFGDRISFEGYIRDINYDRFDDLIVNDTFGDNADATLNIITLFGGTIYNLRDPKRALQTINDSMGKQDILLSDHKLDSQKSRRYFDFAASETGQNGPNFRGKAMLDLLNIDQSFYEVEQYFDEQNMMRIARVRLEVALSIEFSLDGQRRKVSLNKDDTILLWRAWHFNALQMVQLFDSRSFDLTFSSRTKDQEYILLATKIKIEP